MNAQRGDDLIVDGDAAERAERVGTILEIGGSDSHPEYLVHWVVGDYNSLISPWPSVRVRHKAHAAAIPGSRPLADGVPAPASATGS